MTDHQQHRARVIELDEGITQAVCDWCGWHSARFGRDKRLGTMDALQQAKDAGDMHEWESSLGDQ
jgi:hypothetical protein